MAKTTVQKPKTVAKKASNGPCWGYRLKNGVVESMLFDDGNRPKGWKDTPAGLK